MTSLAALTIEPAPMVRLGTLILSMVVTAILTASTIGRWKVLPLHLRRVMPFVIAVFLIISYGSGEAYAQHAPLGLRVYLMPLALLGLLVGLIYGMRLKNPFEPPPPGVWFFDHHHGDTPDQRQG